MITVQWARVGEMVFSGQEYMDAQYEDAIADYAKKKKEWPHVRLILAHDEDDQDWIVLESHRKNPD